MNHFATDSGHLLSSYLNFKVQRVDVFPDKTLLLELFSGVQKTKRWLHLNPALNLSESCFLDERPKKGHGDPPASQKQFRKELVPSVFDTFQISEEDLLVTLTLKQPNGKIRNLRVEFSNLYPRLFLTSVKPSAEKVLSVLETSKSTISKKGSTYISPHNRGEVRILPIPQKHHASPQVRAEPSQNQMVIHQLKRLKKRLQRLEKALDRDLKKHGDSDTFYFWGETLKPFASQLSRGEPSFVVPHSVPPLTIPLNVKLNGKENLEAFFHKAKRSARAHSKVLPRAKRCHDQLDYIEQMLASIDRAQDPSPLFEEMNQWLQEQGLLKAHQQKKQTRNIHSKRKPFRIFSSESGVQIWVGRKAIDNAALTFRHASGNDVFLHARGFAGSHVIVKGGLNQLQPEVLLDAAHLAGWFSKANGLSRVDVQYTERKHVRKASSSNPGQVYISNERVLHLVFDETRLRRLLDNEIKDI